MPREITTYSMWASFRNCRQACAFRYIEGLVPNEKNENLTFGSLIHTCLELWYKTQDFCQLLNEIRFAYPNIAANEKDKASYHLAIAMMRAYVARYPSEQFEVVDVERTFHGTIINPATSAESKSYTMSGKVDAIVKVDNEHWLLEHKTASIVDAAYIDRLWTDFQVTLYSHYIEQSMGIKVSGVIYNILGKAKLRQSAGETEGEYELRLAELIAKSKTGKSTAKRKMPETDDAFQERLMSKYSNDPLMFHREQILIDKGRIEDLQGEIWELTQAMLDARRRNTWYKNTSQCFQYNRPCSYYPICRSGGNSLVIENHYQRCEPHEELRIF